MPKSKKVTKAEKKTQLKRRRTIQQDPYKEIFKPKLSSIVAVHRKYLELLEAKAATLDSFLNLDWFGLVKRSREIDKLERHLRPGQRGIVSE